MNLTTIRSNGVGKPPTIETSHVEPKGKIDYSDPVVVKMVKDFEKCMQYGFKYKGKKHIGKIKYEISEAARTINPYLKNQPFITAYVNDHFNHIVITNLIKAGFNIGMIAAEERFRIFLEVSIEE